MFVTNRVAFGRLLDADNYETHHLHNDMYEVIRNPPVKGGWAMSELCLGC